MPKLILSHFKLFFKIIPNQVLKSFVIIWFSIKNSLHIIYNFIPKIVFVDKPLSSISSRSFQLNYGRLLNRAKKLIKWDGLKHILFINLDLFAKYFGILSCIKISIIRKAFGFFTWNTASCMSEKSMYIWCGVLISPRTQHKSITSSIVILQNLIFLRPSLGHTMWG